VDVDATVMHPNVLIVQTMYAIHAIVIYVLKMIFKHEDLLIDLTKSNKGKLYKGNQLIFLGDGYKAITLMMRNAKDYKPIQKKFKPQLTMREQCKLTMKSKSK
jgi:hypothetical protein